MQDMIDLSELLRDPKEIRELLNAFGEFPPKKPNIARERLIDLTKHIGENPPNAHNPENH